MMMKPLEQFLPEQVNALEGVFFDIDDTFSLDSKILPEAYTALWQLKKAGLKLVPITGRPAGWCDHIARMWPVDAVVGENGAFYFWCDPDRMILKARYFDPDDIRAEKRRRLAAVKDEILSSIPGTGLASDQAYRQADLAIDFCEDVPPLAPVQIEAICRIFEKHGATCKVSSIHVNGWFGNYSKLEMTCRMAADLWGIRLEDHKEKFLFCGDSPNDEPMFEFFPHSIGVSNVLNFKDQLKAKPAYVTPGKGGIGFAQAAAHILAHR